MFGSPHEPPKLYANRYRWRDSAEYKLVVREPWTRLTDEPSLLRDLTRYAVAGPAGTSAFLPKRRALLLLMQELHAAGYAGSVLL